ncbi:hypothetical protein SAMN05216371_0185 [Streptomyces sp. TLI_053]|uniref:hypothetical protein n=1 Tax=Streptomyces sp. TLI_053 TaxID=1855352 RepID=UPI00087B0F37|nr:hypothetical protein [Streptomyces sp. TLI_053]SDS57186.1 hypothetical protein SAMN05216371_0185 [Streptomyces sp. TLI_053]
MADFVYGEKFSETNPVARFTPDQYRRIAGLPNSDFIKLRNRVLSMEGDDPQTKALKASFYSNAITGVPAWAQSAAAMNAAAQHDFRYTIGPTVLPEGEQIDDRHAADWQMADDISKIKNLPRSGIPAIDAAIDAVDSTVSSIHALSKALVLRGVGWLNYTPSPVSETPPSGLPELDDDSPLGGRSGRSGRSSEETDDDGDDGDESGEGDGGGEGTGTGIAAVAMKRTGASDR